MSTHMTQDLGMYSLGALTPAEEHLVRLHLESCERCRLRVDELEGTAELLAAARLAPVPPPGMAEMILAALSAQSSGPAQGPAQETIPLSTPGSALHRETLQGLAAALGRTRPSCDATAPGPATKPGDPSIDVMPGLPGDPFDRSPLARRRRLRRRIAAGMILFVACVALVVLAVVLAPKPPLPLHSFSLQAAHGLTSTGSVDVLTDASGASVRLRVHGLTSGAYIVSVVDAKGASAPAGGFRVADGQDVDVQLHSAADGAVVEVSSVDDPNTPLLQAGLTTVR